MISQCRCEACLLGSLPNDDPDRRRERYQPAGWREKSLHSVAVIGFSSQRSSGASRGSGCHSEQLHVRAIRGRCDEVGMQLLAETVDYCRLVS